MYGHSTQLSSCVSPTVTYTCLPVSWIYAILKAMGCAKFRCNALVIVVRRHNVLGHNRHATESMQRFLALRPALRIIHQAAATKSALPIVQESIGQTLSSITSFSIADQRIGIQIAELSYLNMCRNESFGLTFSQTQFLDFDVVLCPEPPCQNTSWRVCNFNTAQACDGHCHWN